MCVAFPKRRKPRVADAKAVGVNAVAGKGTRFAGAQAAMIAPMRGSLRIGPGTRKRALALALVAACARPPFAEQRALAQDVPDPNVVATAAGQVRGETIDGLRVFRGIPYAAAPVGQLRWRAPRAARPWRDVRAAQDFGAPCWPLAKGVLDRGGLAPSEDCLRLNVWTRAEAGADLPVMVWIHGGALRFGDGDLPLAGAQALTAKDVVLVSFNYRLGVLGFLAHEDFSAQSPRGLSGNYGILDQIAALEWVRDNIAAFGGDADNVTIFEGGPLAWSVCYLNASPRASGLFHRAILQSADCLAHHPQLVDDYVGAPAGHAVGAALTAALDVPSATALRGIAVDDLHARIDTAPWRQAARIVYDDGEVFPGQISALVAHDEQRVPLLLGHQPRAERRALAILPTDVPDWTDTWRSAAAQSSSGSAAAFAAYQAFDTAFRIFPIQTQAAWQADALARHHARHGASTWFFRLPQDQDDGTATGGIFDTNAPAPHLRYWTNFARHGDPNGTGLPRWPAHAPNADLALEIGAEPETVTAFDRDGIDALGRIGALRELAFAELQAADDAATVHAN